MTSQTINLFVAIQKTAQNEDLTEFLGKMLELYVFPFQNSLDFTIFKKSEDYTKYWANVKKIENGLIFNDSLLSSQKQIIYYCQRQLLKEQNKKLNSLFHPDILKANVREYHEKHTFLTEKYELFLSIHPLFIRRKESYEFEVRHDLDVCRFYGVVYSLFKCYLDSLKTTIGKYAPELTTDNPKLIVESFYDFMNEKFNNIEKYSNRLSSIPENEELKDVYRKVIENEFNELSHELKFILLLPMLKGVDFLQNGKSVHVESKYFPSTNITEVKTWSSITSALSEACVYAENDLLNDNFERSIAVEHYDYVYDIFFKNNVDIIVQNIKNLAVEIQKELMNIHDLSTLHLINSNYKVNYEEILNSKTYLTKVNILEGKGDEEETMTYENHIFLKRLHNLLDLFIECFGEIFQKYSIRETYTQNDKDELLEVKFKNQTHKISLLDQLGVIDFLKTKYPILKDNNTKLASLLAGILEITDKTEKDTLRKNLSYLDPNHKKTIRNEKSDREIRAELLKLGIEI